MAYYEGTDTIVSGFLPIPKPAPADTRIDVYTLEKVDPSGLGEGTEYVGTVQPEPAV